MFSSEGTLSGIMLVMPTLKQDLTIQQGATFQFVFGVTGGPASIAGFTAQLQIRPYKTSDEVYADWSTGDGEITVDNAAKQIIINVDEVTTRGYDWDTGVYDLELRGDSTEWRVAEGVARLSREVTR